MVWDQLEAMGTGGNSCTALALCKNETKQNKKRAGGGGGVKKALSRDGFSSGCRYLCWNIPQHSLPGHGKWIGEHWKVE